MRDSELVLRFLAFDRDIKAYKGDFKAFLDETTRYYEQEWDLRSAEVQAGFVRLDLALTTASAIFGEFAFRKWLGNRYERVTNRAVFDCIVRYFAEMDVANLAEKNNGAVCASFRVLCDDLKFRSYIEGSTKTLEATNARLSMWGEKLALDIGKKLDHGTLRIS